MKSIIIGALLTVPRYSGNWISTRSLVVGFSPSVVTNRSFRYARQRAPIDHHRLDHRGGITSKRRALVSDDRILDRKFENDGECIENNKTSSNNNWLVVGDGDLSYSAAIAEDLTNENIQLFATVLEEEQVHYSVYKRSSENKAAILSYRKQNSIVAISNTTEDSVTTPPPPPPPITTTPTTQHSQLQHQVLFGIDATQLKYHFPTTKFKTIEFNFPHWRGKTNAKRNRQLLDTFMGSATEVLDKEGEIVISLCEGQGGFPASTAEEWKRSWLVPKYAAEHGLLLRDLRPYEPAYQQTSHRGKDRPWVKDGKDQRYVFAFPNEKCIDEEFQISCRHELRVVLPKDFVEGPTVSRSDIVEGDAVFRLTEDFVPQGIRMQVVTREILDPYVFDGEEATLAIFLLNYSGEKMPLTRETADTIRSKVEATVRQDWGFKIAKAGRLVSLPYPTHLLPSLVWESTQRMTRLTTESSNLETKASV